MSGAVERLIRQRPDLLPADAETVDKKLRPGGFELQSFCTQLRAALVSQDTRGELYTYKISRMDERGVDVEVGFRLDGDTHVSTVLTLRADSRATVISDTFDYLIDRNQLLEDHSRRLAAENRKNEAQRDDALRQFDTVRHDKERLEQELYSKFVLILNAKKHKANEFKKQIAALTARVADLNAELDAVRAAADASHHHAQIQQPTIAAAAAEPEPLKRKSSSSLAAAAAAVAATKPPAKKARASIAQTPTLPTQLSQLSLPFSMPVDAADDAADELAVERDERDDAERMPPPPVPVNKSRKGTSDVRPSLFGLHTAPPLSAPINDNDLLSRSDDSDVAVPLAAGETVARSVIQPALPPEDQAAARRVRRASSEKQPKEGERSVDGESQPLRRGGALTKQPNSVPAGAQSATRSMGPTSRAVAGRASHAAQRQRRSSRGAALDDDSVGASGLLKHASQEE